MNKEQISTVKQLGRCVNEILNKGLIYPTKKETHHLELFNSQQNHK